MPSHPIDVLSDDITKRIPMKTDIFHCLQIFFSYFLRIEPLGLILQYNLVFRRKQSNN